MKATNFTFWLIRKRLQLTVLYSVILIHCGHYMVLAIKAGSGIWFVVFYALCTLLAALLLEETKR